jgi:hypothetical protein
MAVENKRELFGIAKQEKDHGQKPPRFNWHYGLSCGHMPTSYVAFIHSIYFLSRREKCVKVI